MPNKKKKKSEKVILANNNIITFYRNATAICHADYIVWPLFWQSITVRKCLLNNNQPYHCHHCPCNCPLRSNKNLISRSNHQFCVFLAMGWRFAARTCGSLINEKNYLLEEDKRYLNIFFSIYYTYFILISNFKFKENKNKKNCTTYTKYATVYIWAVRGIRWSDDNPLAKPINKASL